MKIVRCDICNNEMRTYIFDRDSETQHYTLINSYGGRDIETDNCNICRFAGCSECDDCLNGSQWVRMTKEDEAEE